jgi:hypothetical protein
MGGSIEGVETDYGWNTEGVTVIKDEKIKMSIQVHAKMDMAVCVIND